VDAVTDTLPVATTLGEIITTGPGGGAGSKGGGGGGCGPGAGGGAGAGLGGGKGDCPILEDGR